MAKKTYTYVADDGAETTVVLDEFYGNQAALGFTAATGPNINKPLGGGFRPRQACVVDATGYTRRIPCGGAAATAYTTPNTVVLLRKVGSSASITGHTYGHEGEKLINRKDDATFGG